MGWDFGKGYDQHELNDMIIEGDHFDWDDEDIYLGMNNNVWQTIKNRC